MFKLPLEFKVREFFRFLFIVFRPIETLNILLKVRLLNFAELNETLL